MNQILKYPGGKWRIAEWIIGHFPAHKVYVEPYFGSGAVFFCKEPDYIETVNDINGDIINIFQVCREKPEELAYLISMTPWSRGEFILCDEESDDPVERARRTLVRYHQSFGTSNISKSSWKNVQTYGGPRCATMWNCLPEIIIDCCGRLKNAQIECIDAIELIKRYDDPETLIYADPPYLLNLRKKDIYKHNLTDADHVCLLEALLQTKSKVILSAYQSDLYDDMLKGWITDDKVTTAQMGLKRTERLYMNYEPPMLGLIEAME